MLALRETTSVLSGGKQATQPSQLTHRTQREKSELIPSNVGDGVHRKKIQNRTLLLWAALAATGLSLFNQTVFNLSPKARAAALTLVFPGAGYIACANLVGTAFLILTYILLPVCLFAWFGAGGSFFPAVLWLLSGFGAYYSAGDRLFEWSALISVTLLGAFLGYFNRSSAKARTKASAKRAARNDFLPAALKAMDTEALNAASETNRELSLEDLRMVQWTIDQGHLKIDDWTNFTVIDQFQTSALRYQLYEMMYCLGAYQGIYTPNFHGYSAQAFRNTIEKSLTPKVLGFWKWETRWGKFSTDYEPVNKDNIMVTGFLLQGMMLYTANTRDMRYTLPKSMKFMVSNKHVYEHDIHSLDRALVKQWNEDPYCLFSCEPNWIYTPCNLQGMTGQVIYDRVFGTDHAKQLLPVFEESLNTNFTEADGSIIPIRSQMTGFTIPGLCGALTDLVNALLCRGHLNHIARRMWAIFKKECIELDEATGELRLKGLVGADKIDPGNYTSNEYALLPILAYVAGEYGDEKVRKGAIDLLQRGVGWYTTSTGARALNKDKASNSMNSCMVRAALLRKEDWLKLVSEGPCKTALDGPILDKVPYPGVLVAKARSHSSKDLDLVLYPSAESGVFELGLKCLQPGTEYLYGDEGRGFKADNNGEASLEVLVDGRTAVKISPRVS